VINKINCKIDLMFFQSEKIGFHNKAKEVFQFFLDFVFFLLILEIKLNFGVRVRISK